MTGKIKKQRRKQRKVAAFLRSCAIVGIFLIVMTGAAIYMEKGQRTLFSAGGNDYSQLLDLTDYPESLQELYENNPEAAQFVLDYPQKESSRNPVDLSDEVERGTIPLFLQWDERWGYELYGNDFLAVTGCGPTCLSMVYCGLTGDTEWNPYRMAQKAEDEGYYVEDSGSSWEMMTGLAEELGLTAREVIFDEDHILAELNAGHPIICSMRAGDFTTSGHFIVLVGTNDDRSIAVNDPNSRINSETSWDLDRIMSQVRNLWAYSYEK